MTAQPDWVDTGGAVEGYRVPALPPMPQPTLRSFVLVDDLSLMDMGMGDERAAAERRAAPPGWDRMVENFGRIAQHLEDIDGNVLRLVGRMALADGKLEANSERLATMATKADLEAVKERLAVAASKADVEALHAKVSTAVPMSEFVPLRDDFQQRLGRQELINRGLTVALVLIGLYEAITKLHLRFG